MSDRPVTGVAVSGCPTHRASQWLVPPGGIYTIEPGCVHLLLDTTDQGTMPLRLPIGAPRAD